MNISKLGWNNYFNQHFQLLNNQDLTPYRVYLEHRNLYHISGEHGELVAEVSGKFRHTAQLKSDYPSVGDWVAVQARPEEGKATIQALLPRKSCISRKTAGIETDEQVLASNIDTAFLVSGLDNDFNVRRIERYLTIVWESGATPIIILNKKDICKNLDECLSEVETVTYGLPVHTISAVTGEGMEQLSAYLTSSTTAVFLGSSGVGKSTIINTVLGEDRLDTGGIRLDDSRGRHTTVNRELIVLPEGGIVIDTPGLREIQLWADGDGLKKTFNDIEELITQCRFKDCKHETEPGCTIKEALENGTLDQKRYNSYVKQQKELYSLSLRKNQREYHRVCRDRGKKIRQYFQDLKKLNLKKNLQ
jgi:ribosome biogenesis GTPase / thiamine phosphate phosphatase